MARYREALERPQRLELVLAGAAMPYPFILEYVKSVAV